MACLSAWGLGFLSFVYSQCSQYLSATTKVQQTLSYLSIKDLKVNMKQALLRKKKNVVHIKAVLVIRIKVKQVVWIKVKPVTQMKAEPVVQIM